MKVRKKTGRFKKKKKPTFQSGVVGHACMLASRREAEISARLVRIWTFPRSLHLGCISSLRLAWGT